MFITTPVARGLIPSAGEKTKKQKHKGQKTYIFHYYSKIPIFLVRPMDLYIFHVNIMVPIGLVVVSNTTSNIVLH